MIDGRRVGRTFDTPEEAVYWAAGLKTRAKAIVAPQHLTVAAAVDRYMESKNAILSPSTLAGYQKIKKGLMAPIAAAKLSDLTQEKIQRWVNALTKQGKAPKTVANAHGLLSAVLAEYRPDFALRTRLPQKVKSTIQIPSEAELKAILAAAKGTRYELPIVLAAWLGLRQSEILGLTWDDIHDSIVLVKSAIVVGEHGPVEKGPKTYSGTRSLPLPAYVKALLDATPRTQRHIVSLSGKAIYSGFSRICEKAGVPHFRFHDLRHLNASIMLAAGIPDKYSMERMGHATSHMLRTTYQHTMAEKAAAYDEVINNYFLHLLKPE